MLSINAIAHGADEHHATAKEKHEDHAAALGKPGDAAKVSRTMEVDMNDTMKFTPSAIKVKKGETIRMWIENIGEVCNKVV